jgi:predicted permease
VVDAVLLRPLPYAASGRIVALQHSFPGINFGTTDRLNLGMFFTYQGLSTSIEQIAAYQTVAVNVGDERHGGVVERAHAGRVTANVFAVLGVAPQIGRPFSDAEDRPGGPAVVLISDGLWHRVFDANASVIGTTVPIDGTLHHIVGVMPEMFRFPESSTDVWLPLRADRATPYAGGYEQQAIARLRPNVDLPSARRELQTLVARVSERFPLFAPGLPTAAVHAQSKPQANLQPLRESLVGDIANVLWIVAGAVGLVLFAAWTNVANLVLVRVESRHRELAVRTALGASRARIFGHIMAEIALLAVVGSALGFVAAAAGVRLMTRFAPPTLPRLTEIRIDHETALFVALVGIVVIAGCGVAASLRQRANATRVFLKDGGGHATTGRLRLHLRGILVTTQVALAMLLLASAGVLARSFERVRAVRPGFDDTNVLTMWFSTGSAYRTDAEIARYYTALVDQLAQVPGVVAVGVASKLPLAGDGISAVVLLPETGPQARSSPPQLSLIATANGGFFDALRIPLVAGNAFSRGTGQPERLETIVNAAVAKSLWNDSNGRRALGQRLRFRVGGPVYTVVGVAADVRDTSLLVAPSPIVYVPMTANADARVPATMGVVVRTIADPLAAVGALRAAAASIDPSVPVFKVAPLREVVGRSVIRLSFTLLALGVGAGVTLVLCMIGLYGVIAYVVRLRTREIGVRIALGATSFGVVSLVTRQAFALTGCGIAAGVALFLTTARFLRAFAFGVAPTDSATLVAVAAGLLLTSVLASWIPVQRARSIDPMEALRHD